MEGRSQRDSGTYRTKHYGVYVKGVRKPCRLLEVYYIVKTFLFSSRLINPNESAKAPSSMASALRRTASRLRHRLRSSSVLLSPPCISDALRQGVDSSLPRPVRQLFSLSWALPLPIQPLSFLNLTTRKQNLEDPTAVLIRNTNVVPEKTFVER